MVSIKTIAEKSGFSTATVSRYINNNGYVSDKTKAIIAQIIEDLNYKPSLIARSLVTKRSNIIGLIIPNISSPFLSNFTEGVEKAAKERGYNIFLCHSHDDLQIESIYLSLLAERRVDAIISMPVGGNVDLYREISRDIPIVFAVRTLEELDISSIIGNDFDASYQLVQHLIKKGHERIGFINGRPRVSTGKERLAGVKAALSDNRIDVIPQLMMDSDYSVEGGYEAAKILLSLPDKPTAIYTANNLLSVGAMMAIEESGYKIPDDISLVAFDGFDGTYAEKMLSPSITSNIYPSRKIGERAVNLILEQIANKEDKLNNHSEVFVSQSITINMAFQERASVREINRVGN